jgi:hypothetical protein
VPARPGRLRTLNSRMLIWLPVMLFAVTAGGVVGIVMQQRRLHETRRRPTAPPSSPSSAPIGRCTRSRSRPGARALVVSFPLSSPIASARPAPAAAIGSPLARLRRSARRLGRGDVHHRVGHAVVAA